MNNRTRRTCLRRLAPVALALILATTYAAHATVRTRHQTRSTPQTPAAGQAKTSTTNQSAAPPAANPADVASVDAILAALYDVISGPAGQKRDWNRLRSLFIPEARMIPVVARKEGGFGARVLSVEDYIKSSGTYLETNGFFERETARKQERYGNLVHAFSAYESRNKIEDTEPFARGTNSIQLIFDGTRWWVVTVAWDSERKPAPPVKK